MKQSIDDFPIEIFIEIISNLSFYVDNYFSLKLVSSRWNEAVNCYFKTIKNLVQAEKPEDTRINLDIDCLFSHLTTKNGLVALYSSHPPDEIISYMKLFPNLTAVSVFFFDYTKEDQDTLFNYLNTRPTITSLELFCDGRFAKLQNDVKLTNIRNFALDAETSIEDAISRLFQADHKLEQLYVNTHVNSKLPFEDGISILKRMPSLKMFSEQISLKDYGMLRLINIYCPNLDSKDLYTKQPGLCFENLESYCFYAHEVRFLNYLDNFVACCPNLKNIDCCLLEGDAYETPMLNNPRAHTNVENLVIRGENSSCEFVLKILEMFPMVKNLKLKKIEEIGRRNQITRALLKLPNLSLLYLHRSLERPRNRSLERPRNRYTYRRVVRGHCVSLKEAYNSKYGRDFQIVRRSDCADYYDPQYSFRHGFDFMKNNFWADCSAGLLAD